MTSTSAAPAATAAQELPTTLDSQSGILTATSLMKSTLDDPERPPQVAVADDKQEWEICDIVGKEEPTLNAMPVLRRQSFWKTLCR